jgi:hypothetical protein
MDRATLEAGYRPVHPLRYGQMAYMPNDALAEDAPLPDTVVVAGECTLTGDFYIIEGVPREGLFAWYGGELIQYALPTLSLTDRAFLTTGLRPNAFADFAARHANEGEDDDAEA